MEQASELSLCARLGKSTERSPVEPKSVGKTRQAAYLEGDRVEFRATLFQENSTTLEESRSGERP